MTDRLAKNIPKYIIGEIEKGVLGQTDIQKY